MVRIVAIAFFGILTVAGGGYFVYDSGELASLIGVVEEEPVFTVAVKEVQPSVIAINSHSRESGNLNVTPQKPVIAKEASPAGEAGEAKQSSPVVIANPPKEVKQSQPTSQPKPVPKQSQPAQEQNTLTPCLSEAECKKRAETELPAPDPVIAIPEGEKQSQTLASAGTGIASSVPTELPRTDDSTPPPEPEPQPEPTPPPVIASILISQILFDAEGSDTGKEFIQLHNTGSASLDLKGWSLKIEKEGSTISSLGTIGSKSEDNTTIAASGTFTIGFNKYESTADMTRSTALPNSNATVVLYDAEGAEKDRVSYNSETHAVVGWSR